MFTKKTLRSLVIAIGLPLLFSFYTTLHAAASPLKDALTKTQTTISVDKNLNNEKNINISEPTTIFDVVEYLKEKPSESEQEKEEISNSYQKPVDVNIIKKDLKNQNLESKIQKDYSSYKRRVCMGDVKEGEKVVYLTFDDGPSENTLKILDILRDYNLKATFFINRIDGDLKKKICKRIIDEGHSIGNHGYSHNYKKIYSSVDAFFEDFIQLEDILYEEFGIRPKLTRFPGGSNNEVSWEYGGKLIMYKIVDELNEREYKFCDWNTSVRDAEKVSVEKQDMIDSVLYNAKKMPVLVVLMHDTNPKKDTVEVLPTIIKGLIAMSYEFRPMDENSYAVQFCQNPDFDYTLYDHTEHQTY